MSGIVSRALRKARGDGFGRLAVDGAWYASCSVRSVFEAVHPTLYAYSRGYYRNRWLKNRGIGAYSRSPDPTRIVWVDPDRIEYRTGRSEPVSLQKSSDIGRVEGGNWDESGLRFDQSEIFRSLRQRYVQETNWEETVVVRERVPPWDLDSPAEVREKCARMDRLWDSIRKRGYVTQYELLLDDPTRYREKYFPGTLTNEITVDVGRDGELLFVDSFHRLSMAKILGLDSVPVTVLVRHEEWMNRLNNTSGSDSGSGRQNRNPPTDA